MKILDKMNEQRKCRIIRGYDRIRDAFYFVAKVTDFAPNTQQNEQQYEYFVFVFDRNGEFQELLSSEQRHFFLYPNEDMNAQEAVNLLRHLLLDDTDGNKILYPCPIGFQSLKNKRIKWMNRLFQLIAFFVPLVFGLPWTVQGTDNHKIGGVLILIFISFAMAFASTSGRLCNGKARVWASICFGSCLWIIIMLFYNGSTVTPNTP